MKIAIKGKFYDVVTCEICTKKHRYGCPPCYNKGIESIKLDNGDIIKIDTNKLKSYEITTKNNPYIIKINDNDFIVRTVRHEQFCNHVINIITYNNSKWLVNLEFYNQDGYGVITKKLGN